MAENTWWTYVSRITNGASGIQIATLTGLDAGAISRWKSGRASVSAEAAVRLARAVHRPPVEALVAAGFLEASEVEQVVHLPASIREVSDEDLLEEIRRRMGQPDAGARVTDGRRFTIQSTDADRDKPEGLSERRSRRTQTNEALAARTRDPRFAPDDPAGFYRTSDTGEAPE